MADPKLEAVGPDGTVYKMGLLPEGPRMKLRAGYEAAQPLIPESDWPRKGGGLREHFPFDWDQNPNNSCGGHGAAIALNAAKNFSGDKLVELSPDYIYSLCNGGRDQGSMPDDLLDALTNRGTCLRSTVGHGAIFRNTYDTRAADAEAARFRADAVLTCTAWEELVTAVLRKQGLFTGVPVDDNYFRPDSRGRQVPGGQFKGYHCTAQIGEVEYMDDLRAWGLWTRGSWGKRFGQDGWYWTHMNYFVTGLRDFRGCVIASAKQDPQDPQPVATDVAA